jgi:NAD(P)-dependent dehydrogenase (short-subunit alcohol dehydrogenase family)
MSVLTTDRPMRGATDRRPLLGQTALVTGASWGVAAGVVRVLAAAGAAVAVNYVTGPEAAEAIVADIRRACGSRRCGRPPAPAWSFSNR